jgi:hypothetical protein
VNLARVVLRWIGHFVLLLIFTLLLLIFAPPTVQYIRQASGDFEQGLSELRLIREARQSLMATITKELSAAKVRIDEKSKYAGDQLRTSVRERIAEIDQERAVRAAAPAKPLMTLGIAKIGFDAEALQSKALAAMHDELLQQERQVLFSLLSVQARTELAPADLETLRLAHVEVNKKLKENLAARKDLEGQAHFWELAPWMETHKKLALLEAQGQRLFAENQAAAKRYDDKKRQIKEMLGIERSVMSFDPDEFLAPLRDAEKATSDSLSLNWLGSVIVKAPAAISAYLPRAMLIVMGVILMPVGIKAALYYVFAPLASRRKAIALLPERAGEIEELNAPENPVVKPLSSVSQSIVIDPRNELLVHPEYLQSSPHGSTNTTRWRLSGRYWLSSLAAGLYLITRMRAEEPLSVVVSATHDPLSEVGVIGLPAGSCIVLQPRHLVGLVQLRDQPIRITSHWRLGSLHAWLTLQVRFLVFHGPGKLIVKGCRGVRVEKADSGRSINQAATIGFSANLAYTSRRSETFISYLSGKQPLLHDSFAGTQGYCVYQEMPHKGERSGVTGRGLEGFTDALLKVFGV